jgi:hypothetical protein
MKLTGTAELAVVAALVGLISFMPTTLSALVSSPVGKAVAFGFVAYLWKQHNELVALLLAVALVKACPAYERMTDVEAAAAAAAAAKKKEEGQHPPMPTENMAPKY